jgi:hypothetical protein
MILYYGLNKAALQLFKRTENFVLTSNTMIEIIEAYIKLKRISFNKYNDYYENVNKEIIIAQKLTKGVLNDFIVKLNDLKNKNYIENEDDFKDAISSNSSFMSSGSTRSSFSFSESFSKSSGSSTSEDKHQNEKSSSALSKISSNQLPHSYSSDSFLALYSVQHSLNKKSSSRKMSKNEMEKEIEKQGL